MITNKQRYLSLIILALLLAISTGCDFQRDPGGITEAPAVSQTSTPVKTDIPEKTKTPFILSTDTITFITTTEIPSPVATMTDTDREVLVQNFLETSETCRLSCLWEVIPGETYWLDLENRLHLVGIESIGSTTLQNGDIFHGLGGFDLGNRHIFNHFSFAERDGVVTKIHLISEGYANPEYFQEQWYEYSPKQIMTIYGKPSRVWLKTRARTMGDRHGYGLWLVYDEYGFIIQYTGFLEEMEKILHICPRFEDGMDIMWLQIHIQAANDSDLLENMGGLVSPEPQAGKKGIEVATGLSVDEFYELFIQEQNPACFDTPAKIWK